MSNRNAAKVAAAASRFAVKNPSTLAVAHGLLQEAKKAGATDAEIRKAGKNAR